MRTVAHLSDLHFGRVDPALLEPLRQRIETLKPDVVVISGDLTQRAKPEEFREARRFLDSLPQPQIVVPGNHDVPLYNVLQRFFTPLRKYRRYISDELEPAYIDDEIAVVGVNTARSLVFKGGRINIEQVEAVRAELCELDQRIVKIVVSHHPFDLPEHWDDDDIAGRAREAMEMFSRCGADILLAGHVHMSHTGDTTARYKIGGYAALIVQAGTTTSTRGRGETNSFNALRVTQDAVTVERYSWEDAARDFALSTSETFSRSERGWTRVGRKPPPP
jgi:3',5'-cyclic AMP phosphodiesterase CpdA